MCATPAIFLDRDGVINQNRDDYVKSWDEFAFLPGALPALREVAGLGWPVVVVTNQAAIGRGLVSQAAVDDLHRRMLAAVRGAGGRLDAVLYCPHRREDACGCRKPRPGLLLQAAARWDLDLARSILIGDAASDVLAAQAAGCRPVLVRTGRGEQQRAWLAGRGLDGFHVADDLADAVAWVKDTLVMKVYC